MLFLRKPHLDLKFRIVFWDDDGGSMYLWNVGRQLFYTALHPRRQFWTSYSPLWELTCGLLQTTWRTATDHWWSIDNSLRDTGLTKDCKGRKFLLIIRRNCLALRMLVCGLCILCCTANLFLSGVHQNMFYWLERQLHLLLITCFLS
jgi:hypothetical protein